MLVLMLVLVMVDGPKDPNIVEKDGQLFETALEAETSLDNVQIDKL